MLSTALPELGAAVSRLLMSVGIVVGRRIRAGCGRGQGWRSLSSRTAALCPSVVSDYHMCGGTPLPGPARLRCGREVSGCLFIQRALTSLLSSLCPTPADWIAAPGACLGQQTSLANHPSVANSLSATSARIPVSSAASHRTGLVPETKQRAFRQSRSRTVAAATMLATHTPA